MIPTVNSDVIIRVEQYRNKTYRLDFNNKRIVGSVDNLDAVVQSVQKILSTPRYSERIYSGDYGLETYQLIGKSIPYVEANIWLLVNDALMVDDRILSVTIDRVEQVAVDELRVVFTVESRHGIFNSSLSIGG